MKNSRNAKILFVVFSAIFLFSCGKNDNEKILGKWEEIFSGNILEFLENEIRFSTNGKDFKSLGQVDKYSFDKNLVTVSSKSGERNEAFKIFENGKKICAQGAQSGTFTACFVRPDRLGRLAGTWGLDKSAPASNQVLAVKFTEREYITPLGKLLITDAQFDGDKVTLHLLNTDKNSIIAMNPGALPPVTMIFKGNDTLCPLPDPSTASNSSQQDCLYRINEKQP